MIGCSRVSGSVPKVCFFDWWLKLSRCNRRVLRLPPSPIPLIRICGMQAINIGLCHVYWDLLFSQKSVKLDAFELQPHYKNHFFLIIVIATISFQLFKITKTKAFHSFSFKSVTDDLSAPSASILTPTR